MKKIQLFPKKTEKSFGKYYENSTQRWLPIEDIYNGIILLKDGRYIKVIEVLPVNFYLKSDVEQENIIYYFAAYLKIAPDNLQIRVVTQRADIEKYLAALGNFAENEQNDFCRSMIADETKFVKGLSENFAVKKRFFIIFEYTAPFGARDAVFTDVCRVLGDETYKAMKYLSQCGLEVVNISDNSSIIDLLYSMINKQTARTVKPEFFDESMLDEIHIYEGGRSIESAE